MSDSFLVPLRLRRLFLPPRSLWTDIPYIHPGLLPSIRDSLRQCTALLTPAQEEECRAIVERLFLHFARRPGEGQDVLFADYLWFFSPYPADILRQGVMQLVRQHRYPTLPTVAQCLELMEPALATRHYQHTKLTELALAAEHWASNAAATQDP